MPIDLPETAAVRGSALEGEDLDPRVIISDRSAAWVWGWTHRPPRLSSSVSVAARIPSTDRRRLGTREVVIRADEVMAIGAVRVTAPLRTLIDLARHDDGADIIAMLARGLQEHAITSASIEHELRTRGRLSYVRRARERLVAARAELDLLSRC